MVKNPVTRPTMELAEPGFSPIPITRLQALFHWNLQRLNAEETNGNPGEF